MDRDGYVKPFPYGNSRVAARLGHGGDATVRKDCKGVFRNVQSQFEQNEHHAQCLLRISPILASRLIDNSDHSYALSVMKNSWTRYGAFVETELASLDLVATKVDRLKLEWDNYHPGSAFFTGFRLWILRFSNLGFDRSSAIKIAAIQNTQNDNKKHTRVAS